MRSSLLFVFTLLSAILLAVQAAPVPAVEAAAESSDAASPLTERRGMTASRITYYAGGMMNNPACGGSTPNDNSMIAAVKQGGAFSCGDRLSIKKGSKHVTVRVVDYCGGCDGSALDLSKGAFKKLGKLSQGVINGAKVSWV